MDPKASAAATQAAIAEEFLREPFNKRNYVENEPLILPNKRDYVENEPSVLPGLINIQLSLLALHFRAQAKDNSVLAHKMAWEWLKGGFPFYPPPEVPQSVLSDQLQWHARTSAREFHAERRAWKIDTEPVISFEAACQTDWCRPRYKNPRGLIAMLKDVEYPKPLLSIGLINRPAFEVAVQRYEKLRRKRDTERKREERKAKHESRAKPLQQRSKRNSS
jgi:hypothetical protein